MGRVALGHVCFSEWEVSVSFLKSAACVLALQGVAGLAQAAVYECGFSNVANHDGWITDRYVFDYDEAAGKAVVEDAVILALLGEPVAARSVEETKGKVVFVWEVLANDVTGQQTRMLYRAAWFKGEGFMRITATPQGYSNSYKAEGTCRIG